MVDFLLIANLHKKGLSTLLVCFCSDIFQMFSLISLLQVYILVEMTVLHPTVGPGEWCASSVVCLECGVLGVWCARSVVYKVYQK